MREDKNAQEKRCKIFYKKKFLFNRKNNAHKLMKNLIGESI